MAFDSLSEKLQNVFKNLRSKGKLTEDDVKAALKEVKMALLEADVNFKVVKQFTKSVQERAIGQDVMNGLNPGQMVIKIVNEEMIKLMGSETTEIAFRPGKELTVIMMVGLQGAGKTTTTAKIAGKLKSKGKKSLLVACDVYRPAAIEQLKINGEKQGVEVFSMGDKNKPADIAKAAVEHAKKNDFNVVIIDTAGRLHIDEDMMAELIEIKEATDVFQTILVVDAMTGQDAVNVAKEFDEKIERYDMQYDTFTVAKENTVKKLEYQMLETDTGIEIKIPMEEYNTKDNVEIIEEPGGGSTIIIKNIENVKIK